MIRKILTFIYLVVARCETEFEDCFEPRKRK